MNVAGASNGFEKVCGVPTGTVTQEPASTSTFSVPDVKRSLPWVTMNTSSWSRWICWGGIAGPGGTLASMRPRRCPVCDPSSMIRTRMGPPPDCSPSIGPTTWILILRPPLRVEYAAYGSLSDSRRQALNAIANAPALTLRAEQPHWPRGLAAADVAGLSAGEPLSRNVAPTRRGLSTYTYCGCGLVNVDESHQLP